MKRPYIIALVILVLIIGAWYFFFRGSIAPGFQFSKSNLPPEEKVYELEKWIKSDPAAAKWKADIQARADQFNQSFNERLREEVLDTLKKSGY